MKHHYLIDYENVHEDGLTGLNDIEEDAVIHIFYSDRARKLDLDSFREGQILQIEALKVPVGKQSLDMQLVSYMGYLMGKERGEGNSYIIISKDNGYQNSIPFWRQIMKDGTTVEIRPQIRPTPKEETPKAAPPQPRQNRKGKGNTSRNAVKEKQPKRMKPETVRENKNPAAQEAPAASADASLAESKEEPAAAEKHPAESTEAPLAESTTEPAAAEKHPAESTEAPLAESKTDAPAVEDTSSEAETESVEEPRTPYEKKEALPKQKTVVDLPQEKQEGKPKGKTKGTDRARKTKSSEAASATPSEKTLDRSALNTTVMQTLARNNVEASVIGKISSIVLKHASEEQNKTKIYREIIRTLGQKEGLIVYTYIKTLL